MIPARPDLAPSVTSMIVLGALVALAAPGLARAGDPRGAPGADSRDTVDYIVRAGDTCYGIAARELGDRARLPVLHRHNPQLGPLPHNLRPGQVLKLPRLSVDPDATLTGASGLVRFRRPAQAMWDAARHGMDLFRAWRIGAEARSSAEVTFRDRDQLQLRENTIVIIYGPARAAAKVTPAQAVLERGTLRSRLGELSPTVRVTTPTAVATLGTGSALVSVLAGEDASTVANHDGAAIPVVGRGRARGTVRVAAGMGSRVVRGRPPEPPRPLPPAPAWMPSPLTRFAAVGAEGAVVSASWTAVASAARYRVEILSPSGTIVGTAEVPAGVTRFELVRVPPGEYQARVASIDVDRLEGKPGPLLPLTVLPVAIRPPGGEVAGAAAPGPAADPDARIDGGGARPASPLAARGATVGSDALACSTAGWVPGVAHLLTLGPVVIHCATAGTTAGPDPAHRLAPFTVDVVGISARLRGGAPTIELVRDQPRTVTVELASVAPIGRGWTVEPVRGVTVDTRRLGDGALAVTLRAGAEAPAISRLFVVDDAGGPPLTSLPVVVSDRAGAQPRPR
jgi:hypothetical protein